MFSKKPNISASGKCRICVTGGTGYIASWTVKCLLEEGYSVNATLRIFPGRKRDISYLKNLAGAPERLRLFHADLDEPESFVQAIEGCVGVFHMAHPLDFDQKESEQVKLDRVTSGLKGILKACADSKTVKRIVLTSSISAFGLGRGEDYWTDLEMIRSMKIGTGPYIVTKTITEKLAFEIADELGLDLVSIGPTWVSGPFICPYVPDSVHLSLALINGDEKLYMYLKEMSLVHVEDVAKAHIHLFEHREAKGRYLCSAVDVTIDELHDFISRKYPQYKLPNPESWIDVISSKTAGVSSKKLIETGFNYQYGFEEMIDGAIRSCNAKGVLFRITMDDI